MIEEIKGDLFDNEGVALCHCVSRDLEMGRGIAVEFKKRFQRVDELVQQQKQVGDVAVLDVETVTPLYYLITKERYFHKPTYGTLRSSLMAMKAHAVANQVKNISMPKIGCGLDRLEWSKVKKIIAEVFQDTNIQIKVYSLEP